jgi:soluble lytic murein transglycosylase-like protein
VQECFAAVNSKVNGQGDSDFPIILAGYSGITDPDLLKKLIVMYGIESKFNTKAVSPVGAVGLGQLMWPTAEELAKELDLTITKDSLYDVSINLRLSSYLFNKLLQSYSGNVTLTLVAYNAGPSRADKLKRLAVIPNETNSYVTRFHYLYEGYCK